MSRKAQSVLRSAGEALTFGAGMVVGLALPSLGWALFETGRAILIAAVLVGIAVVALVRLRAYGLAAGATLGAFLSVFVLSIVAASPIP